ncbi:RNA methyltransferase [Diaporthe eres]|uniref:rRNA methyltransferase 1, mitochondrial n=1 Tax=Diaporthe vaccinii TaxID=105482 RepID=A0ABR4F4X3_9PEZI|nr:RNA methyltransferase [Diaporthe eres]
MSFVTKLPLLGRNPALRVALLPLSSQRCASRLSAIHQGLNRSERARPQGSSPRKEIRQRPGDDPYLSPEERRRARAIARQNPIDFKIRKGKKDITEEPGPPRKSRRARFSDPRDPMGNKSLVKKFQTGQLFDGVETGYGGDREGNLQHDDFVRQMSGDTRNRSSPRDFDREPRRDGSRNFGRSERTGSFGKSTGDQESRTGRKQPPWGDSRPDRGPRDQVNDRRRFDDTSKGFDRRERESRAPSDSFGRDQRQRSSYDAERTSRFESSSRAERRNATYSSQRATSLDSVGRDQRPRSPLRSERTRSTDRDSADPDDAKAWKPRRNDGPVSIPYATAASQFLYGTSAVEAALKAGRRKMYKLYIYRGKGRSTRAAEKDRLLADLARNQGIRVEYLEEASLPMLNKMSESRPHNGHVLEASPLPQLPITALEELSEDQDRPGFKLAVGHQSYEEARINGISGFVSTRPGSRKPLVMVVDQVLDPGNLGAILRTASFMGVTAVAVSKKGSAPVTPVVLKSSAGAAEALTMLSVDSIEDFLRDSKENGWKVYAACPPKSDSKRPSIDNIDLEKDDPLLKDPCILLVGSEGEGLPRALRRAADVEISIPNLSGSDVVDSLNVSVATGLLCSAFLRGKAKARGNTASDPGAIF